MTNNAIAIKSKTTCTAPRRTRRFLLLYRLEAIQSPRRYQYRFDPVAAAGAAGVVEAGDAVPGVVVEDGAVAEAVPAGRLATLTPLAL
jgi:hypothetical protein